MSDTRHKLDKELEKIIGIEGDIDSQLDDLDDEDESLQLPEKVVYDTVESKVPAERRDSDLYDDYEYARTVLRGVMERGTTALENSLMLARESQHPRAFEVTSTLMKNLGDLSKELLQIHKEFDSHNGGGGGKQGDKPTTNIQNNYYNTTNDSKDVSNMLDDLDEYDAKDDKKD